MSLDVLAVRDTGNRGYVIPRLVGYILENHRLDFRLIPIEEIVALIVEYRLHRCHQRRVALTEGIDEPFCGFKLLLHKGSGLFLRPLR